MVELAVAGAAGLKSLAAAKTASAASKIAASHALGLAKFSNIAAAEAAKAQANLETYVYGAPVSTAPPLLNKPAPPTTVPLAPASPFGGGIYPAMRPPLGPFAPGYPMGSPMGVPMVNPQGYPQAYPAGYGGGLGGPLGLPSLFRPGVSPQISGAPMWPGAMQMTGAPAPPAAPMSFPGAARELPSPPLAPPPLVTAAFDLNIATASLALNSTECIARDRCRALQLAGVPVPETSNVVVASDAGLKGLAAVRHADVAAKLAASHALNFAHFSDVAATEATKAQAFLETFVHGKPVSSPPSFPRHPGNDIEVPVPQPPVCPALGPLGAAAAGIAQASEVLQGLGGLFMSSVGGEDLAILAVTQVSEQQSRTRKQNDFIFCACCVRYCEMENLSIGDALAQARLIAQTVSKYTDKSDDLLSNYMRIGKHCDSATESMAKSLFQLPEGGVTGAGRPTPVGTGGAPGGGLFKLSSVFDCPSCTAVFPKFIYRSRLNDFI